MCFRPAIAETPFECPSCGKKINPVMGRLPEECPFCESDISAAAREAMGQSAAAPPQASFLKQAPAPAAPAAAPEAPVAPKAPGNPPA